MGKEKVLLIGGPGNISTSTLIELLNMNYNVAVIKRTKNADIEFDNRVRFYYGDRNNLDFLISTIEDFKPDVVADFICFKPEQAKNILDAIYKKASHYIFVSTIDIYGYPLKRMPMRESDEYSTLVSEYAVNKSECEKLVFEKQVPGVFDVTVVRPTYSFGPDRMFSFLDADGMKYQVARIRAGMPVFVPGDGTTLWHVSCASNTGRMIAQIIDARDLTAGKGYTCGHDSFISFDEYITNIAEVLGIEPKLVHIPADLILSSSGPDIFEKVLHRLTKYNMCFSIEKFKGAFPQFKFTKTIKEGVEEYIKYCDEHRKIPDAGIEILEDRIIRAWEHAKLEYKVRFK